MTIYTKEEKQEIAQIIRNQIGHGALYMIGAKNFAVGENEKGNVYLVFRIRGSKKVNVIKVIYKQGLDLYDIEFIKIHGVNYNLVEKVDGIYFDMFHDVIERVTGLYCSL
jgi:hypothetical protein